MDVRKIMVVVEDDDAARNALQWAFHNIIRFGDIITLLHVYPSSTSRSKKKARLSRLNGFRLALSFQDIYNDFCNVFKLFEFNFYEIHAFLGSDFLLFLLIVTDFFECSK